MSKQSTYYIREPNQAKTYEVYLEVDDDEIEFHVGSVVIASLRQDGTLMLWGGINDTVVTDKNGYIKIERE